jgi:hypothetical protein
VSVARASTIAIAIAIAFVVAASWENSQRRCALSRPVSGKTRPL